MSLNNQKGIFFNMAFEEVNDFVGELLLSGYAKCSQKSIFRTSLPDPVILQTRRNYTTAQKLVSFV